MDMAWIVFRQVLILIVFVCMGIIGVKSGKITTDVSKNLSNILLYFVNPFLIIDSLSVDYDPDKTAGFLLALALGAAMHIVFIFGAHFVFLRKGEPDKLPAERYAVVLSNAGYIGIPLINGIFGKEAVFYLVAYIVCFNVFSWTYGMWVLQKDRRMNLKKMLINPGNIGCAIGLTIYFLRIPLPDMVKSVVSSTAGVNTFLSLFAIGILCAQLHVPQLLRDKRALYVSLCRLVFLPLISFALLIWWIPLVLPENGVMIASVLTAASLTPSAMALSFMCQISGRDPVYGSSLVSVSTVLCVVTVPVLTTLLTALVR
ncbi:MAG: AEC family transporter [Oscillospiraceae bacterium]|nr:AEC family transporter [Oscillospiraceae bacterium]